MTMEDCLLPFDGRLSVENCWVELTRLMPWDLIEDIYAEKFKNEKPDGRRPLSSRIAFGSLHIQASESFTDDKTVENISENPYLQYFLGLHEFHTKPLFGPSMMTCFRKRFTAENIARINEELYRRTHQDGPRTTTGTAARWYWKPPPHRPMCATPRLCRCSTSAVRTWRS